MKNVRIGLVGFGFMGTTHWGIYKGMKGAEVVALADVDAAKRRGDVRKVVGNIGGGDNSKPIDLSGVAVYDDCSLSPEREPAYRAEILSLREKYRGRIDLLLGYEHDWFAPFDPARPVLGRAIVQAVEINLKYEGYIRRQLRQVEEFTRLEEKKLPPDLDYRAIAGLRLEAREKLEK